MHITIKVIAVTIKYLLYFIKLMLVLLGTNLNLNIVPPFILQFVHLVGDVVTIGLL